MTAVSTWCRDMGGSPESFVARVESLGARELVLDATLAPGWLGGLRQAALRRGLMIPAIEAPCPSGPGGRPPFLASDDREERAAAVKVGLATLRLAAECGARVVVVKLGALPGRHDWRETVRAFARGALDASEVERLRAVRTALAPRALDRARFGLEPVLDAAANDGLTIALANRARWFEVPDAGEVAQLAEEFRGAPLPAWQDPAAAHARAALGFAAAPPSIPAAGAWLTDAAGLSGGLPWGRGEVDRAAALAHVPEGALRAVHCAAGVTDEELLEALTR